MFTLLKVPSLALIKPLALMLAEEVKSTAVRILDPTKFNWFWLVLSPIVIVLAIPSTVIGTFYGMNVDLPGGIGDSSTVLGPFTTFIIVILASAIPAILMFAYFKKLGWINS